MAAYYNENDPFTVLWLRELIKRGLIADGEVDDRSICEVQATDLLGYTQHHFFAGIGGWSLALRIAGWDDNRAVCTGSPPCQPFSVAGAGKGVDDARHLAPHWLELIQQFKPPVIFGEQVAIATSKDGWLDTLQDALEAEDYTSGAIVLPACGLNAPHIRQRLWLFAERMADSERQRREQRPDKGRAGREHGARDKAGGSLRNVNGNGGAIYAESKPTYAPLCEWDAPDWLFCRDGKWRPVEPGTFPLADGLPKELVRGSNSSLPHHPSEARKFRLKGYGNAIVPQVAAEVIKSFMEWQDASH